MTAHDRFHLEFLRNHALRSRYIFLLYDAHRDLHSFPTRRSSDLVVLRRHPRAVKCSSKFCRRLREVPLPPFMESDRKSTRLNSSHVSISYAVFCLKKKNIPTPISSLLMRYCHPAAHIP